MYCSRDAIPEIERRFKDRDLKIFWLRPYFSKIHSHFWTSALSNYIHFNQHFLTFPSSRIKPNASRLSWWGFSTRNVDIRSVKDRGLDSWWTRRELQPWGPSLTIIGLETEVKSRDSICDAKVNWTTISLKDENLETIRFTLASTQLQNIDLHQPRQRGIF